MGQAPTPSNPDPSHEQKADSSQPDPARELERLRLLLEVNNALATHLDLPSLLHAISACLRKIVAHDFAGLAIYDETAKQLRVHALEFSRPERAINEGTLLSMSGNPAALAFNSRASVRRERVDYVEFPDPLFRRICETMGLRSGCSVPLMFQDRALGVVSVSSCSEAAFSEQDQKLLEQIAGHFAIAVENALNFERGRKFERRAAHERNRLRLLLEINNAVVSQLDLKELVKSVSASLRDIMPHDMAGIALYEPEQNHLREYTNVAYKDVDAFRVGETISLAGTPAGEVFLTGQPKLIKRPNPAQYPGDRYSQDPVKGSPKSACLALLVSHGRKLGISGVSSTQEDRFTEDDLELFTQISAQIAIAVENLLNFQHAEREKERSQLLLEINNAVVSTLDLRELLRVISVSLCRVIPHDGALLTLHDPETSQLRLQALDLQTFGRKPFEEGVLISLEDTPEGEAITTRQPVLVGPKVDLKRFSSPWVRHAVENGVRSGLAVPLISHDRTLGALSVVSLSEDAFTNEDSELLGQCASQIAIAVENALSYRETERLKNKLASEKVYLEEEIKFQYNFAEIIGQSSALKKILQQVQTVAPTDSAVLLCGETGTGKELIARAIHDLSARKERTLVKLNCAAIPTGLLESELFGHEKGAFTGAIAQRVGRFELANKGTLLLDEVGEIPLDLQPKLLRVLQEHEFERLGSSRTIKTDARLIAATNCDLLQMVAEKRFRSDLFYRLNVFPITIPPLRERIEDIPLLVGYFARKHSIRMNKRIDIISAETIDALCNYSWPGNVRELENFIERAVILSSSSELMAPLYELKVTPVPPSQYLAAGETLQSPRPKPTSLHDVERAHIEEILQQTRGVIGGKGGAAEILGLPVSTLRSRIKKLGLK